VIRPLALIVFCLASGSSETAAQSATGPDATAIRELVRQYAAARGAQDPAATAALFVADADQLVSSGEWRRGRDVLVKGAMASSARTAGTRTLDVDAIRMLGADAAIADARYEIRSGAGETRRMWSTFVVVRQEGAWRISAIRNMLPAAPAEAASAEDRTAVLAVVDDFMRAVSTNDSAALARVRLPDTINIVERPAKAGGVEFVQRRFDPSAVSGNFRERYWDPVVHVRSGIAMVWTPYEFWVDGKTSHCGVDVFEMVRDHGRWRIGNMMWTVEPSACEAMRPADQGRVRPVN
jgi:uncharacterized protein (TIGR02246 family)